MTIDFQPYHFDLQVVVITGASSGLGEALAHSFYTAGCKVVLAARRKDELERVRNDLLEIHSVMMTFGKYPSMGSHTIMQ